MMDAVSLVSCGAAFFLVAVSPGPANISNAAVAMTHGRNTSLKYALGLSCGLVFWGVVAASGMGAVLQTSWYLLSALKLLGGAYLLWLALQSARSARAPAARPLAVTEEKRWFLRGLLLNILNPKTVIAWMAALSVGVDAGDDVAALGAALAVCIGVGFATNALYSLVFSVQGMMTVYRRGRRWVDGAVAALFAVAGLGLIRSAFSR